MRLVSLFSGIGAFEKAFERTNIPYELVGFSEIDKYAIQSYCAIHNVDESLNLGDVSQIRNEDLPQNIDMVTYGFPCQDISISGYQKGITENTRSGLLFEAERIIEYTKPKFAIAENVKNLVGKKFKDDFEALLDRLDSYGYNNYWSVLNAKDYGIPQNRERVFVVSIRKDADKGYEFPKPYDSGLRLKDLLEDEVEDKYYIDNDRTSILLSNLKRQDLIVSETTIVASRGRNPDNPSDRTVGSPTEQRLEPNNQGTTNTLTTVQKDNLVLEKKVLEPNELKLHTNLSGGKWDKIHESARRVYDQEGIAPTIPTCGGGNIEPKVQTDYKIRKLTPLECWRLMGFTDEDYWKARTRLEKVFYKGKDRSNSQMYKQAGNSIVVNVIEQIYQEMRKARLL